MSHIPLPSVEFPGCVGIMSTDDGIELNCPASPSSGDGRIVLHMDVLYSH